MSSFGSEGELLFCRRVLLVAPDIPDYFQRLVAKVVPFSVLSASI